MTLCLYQEIQGVPFQWKVESRALYRCVHCGHLSEPTGLSVEECQQQATRVCPSPTEKNAGPLPAPGWRLLHYLEAYTKDLAAGKPRRTPERVLEIFTIHCSPCPRYNDLAGACNVCGCYVNPVADGTVSNKLLWQKEVCDDQPSQWK